MQSGELTRIVRQAGFVVYNVKWSQIKQENGKLKQLRSLHPAYLLSDIAPP
ncbi:MAG: hypothetical protein WBZ36_00265 [Candidatus Nitrosopolaris sp.]